MDRIKWWRYGVAPEHLRELNKSDRKNVKSFNHWFLVWGIVFCIAAPAHALLFEYANAALSWRLFPAIATAATTIFLILAYLRFYNSTKDELMRKIHYESLSIGFGIAFFLGVGFPVLKPFTGSMEIAAIMNWVGMLLAFFVGLYLRLNRAHYA